MYTTALKLSNLIIILLVFIGDQFNLARAEKVIENMESSDRGDMHWKIYDAQHLAVSKHNKDHSLASR
jgi:hypothetical protein